jgi:hypothetical protein
MLPSREGGRAIVRHIDDAFEQPGNMAAAEVLLYVARFILSCTGNTGARIIFNFSREVRVTNANPTEVKIQGRAFTFLFAAALTVRGAAGQAQILTCSCTTLMCGFGSTPAVPFFQPKRATRSTGPLQQVLFGSPLSRFGRLHCWPRVVVSFWASRSACGLRERWPIPVPPSIPSVRKSRSKATLYHTYFTATRLTG